MNLQGETCVTFVFRLNSHESIPLQMLILKSFRVGLPSKTWLSRPMMPVSNITDSVPTGSGHCTIQFGLKKMDGTTWERHLIMKGQRILRQITSNILR